MLIRCLMGVMMMSASLYGCVASEGEEPVDEAAIEEVEQELVSRPEPLPTPNISCCDNRCGNPHYVPEECWGCVPCQPDY